MKPVITFLTSFFIIGKAFGCYIIITYSSTNPGKIDFVGTINDCSATATYTYSWNFGDGDTSNLPNPSHTYAGFGPYTVNVEGTCSSYPGYVARSSVTINSWEIKGRLVANTHLLSPTDSIKLSLINYNSSLHTYNEIASQIITHDSTYSYDFKNPMPGNYIVKASSIRDTKINEGWTETYADSDLFSINAANINISKVGTVITNTYLQYSGITSGTGAINGNIYYGTAIPGHNIGDGVNGLQIYLLNSSGQLITRTISNMDGSYSFNNLPFGNYMVKAENLGFTTVPKTNINISGTMQTVSGINFVQNSSNIIPKSTSVNELSQEAAIIAPNPCKGIVHIQYPATGSYVQVTITNIAGQKLYENTLSPNTTNSTINISQLQDGLYFIHLVSPNISSTQKLVLQH